MACCSIAEADSSGIHREGGLMRLWLALEDWNGFSSEVVHVREVGPRLVVLDNCPAFAGLGIGDELVWAFVEDPYDWADDGVVIGDVDGAGKLVRDDNWEANEDEEEEEEDGLPTAVRVNRRSPRRSFNFTARVNANTDADSVLDEDAADSLRELLAGEFGQQCLDSGADGGGTMPGSGTVCVPEQESGSDAQAWAWMASQKELTRERLSGRTKAAVDSGEAEILWQFTSVPEMGEGTVPGVRLPGQAIAELEDAHERAFALIEQGSTDQALDLLQASALLFDPWSLAALMLECATAGQWGRASAISYWVKISGMSEECPEHLPLDQWEETAPLAQNFVRWTEEASFLCMDSPVLEPELLLALAYLVPEEVPALEPARARAMDRAARMGSVTALSTLIWEELPSGDPAKSLAVFETYGPSPLSLPDKLASVPASIARAYPDLFQFLGEIVPDAPGEDEWANAQSNAGLAYAMLGNEDRALELWAKAASGSFDARLWPAVLQVVNGGAEGSRNLDDLLIPKADLAAVLEGLEELEGIEGECGPWFARWRQAAQEVCSSATG
jgi:tetratricopeptide (TPR) repeat protein